MIHSSLAILYHIPIYKRSSEQVAILSQLVWQTEFFQLLHKNYQPELFEIAL